MTPTLDQLTPPEIEQLLHGFHNHEKFCVDSLTIRDKKGIPVPVRMFPGPRKLDDAIRAQQKRKKPVRGVILKPRQALMSAAIAAQYFRRVPFFPGQHCNVVADSEDHAKTIFDYYLQYQRSYRPFSGGVPGAEIQLPKLVKDTDDWIRWENDSWVKVITANNVQAGRSGSVRYVHLSEYAFYRDASTLMSGMMQMVPNDQDTIVLVESTANGVGGAFYELWQRASDKRAGSEWIAIFFGWSEHPEYQMEISDPAAFQRDLSRDELLEQQKYNLTLKQLWWRRWCIENNCEGKLNIFRQEYPNCPEEAFISSGRTYFDLRVVARCCFTDNEPYVGDLEVVTVAGEPRIQLTQHPHGDVLMYKRPQRGRSYVIGADSAQGIDPQAKDGNSDPDYASATVLDRETGEQVAKIRERWTEAHFARILFNLGWFYNWAYMVPEANNTGRAVIQELLRLDYPLPLLYKRQRSADDRRPPTLEEVGFLTTSVTRPQLLSALDSALLENAIAIYDSQTAMGCNTLVIHPDGKAAAKQGTHDDDVFSLALAVIGLRHAPRTPPPNLPGQKYAQQQFKPVNYRVSRVEDDD